MADLLDFKNRENFDFFNVSSYYGDQQRFKSALKADCEKVLEYTHKTIQDMCMLGYQLKELKESGRWQWVKNPKTGYCFEGGEFAEFSNYAFGFSKTKTSDFLRISKFLQVRGENEIYLPERYKDYETSQLTELASVEDGRLHYFNPEMTVEEMRLVKRYMEWGPYWDEHKKALEDGEEFDALAYAQAWKAREDEKKNKPQPPEGVLPGQKSIEDFSTSFNVKQYEEEDEQELEEEVSEEESEEEENPTSDLADESDEEETDEIERAREAARQAGIPFSDKPFEGEDDDFNPLAYDGSMSVSDYKQMQEEIAEADKELEEELEEEEETGYNFKTRAGVREFLADSEHWAGRSGYWWFQPACCYTFRNGAMLYALKYTSITDIDTFGRKDCVLYFIKHQGAVSEITKEQIEQYCALHKDEL